MNRNEILDDTPLKFLTAGQLVELIKKSIMPTVIEKPIPEVYGIEMLQQFTGYSKASIYAKTCRGEIPHFKRDGKLFFRHKEIIDWMTANKVETNVEYSLRMDKKLAEKAKDETKRKRPTQWPTLR